MNPPDVGYLWASFLWGGVGTAYAVYGWRQKEPVPLVGGILMIGLAYLASHWLWMSLGCVALMVLVFVLMRRMA